MAINYIVTGILNNNVVSNDTISGSEITMRGHKLECTMIIISKIGIIMLLYGDYIIFAHDITMPEYDIKMSGLFVICV